MLLLLATWFDCCVKIVFWSWYDDPLSRSFARSSQHRDGSQYFFTRFESIVHSFGANTSYCLAVQLTCIVYFCHSEPVTFALCRLIIIDNFVELQSHINETATPPMLCAMFYVWTYAYTPIGVEYLWRDSSIDIEHRTHGTRQNEYTNIIINRIENTPEK